MRRYLWLFIVASLCLIVFAGLIVSGHSLAASNDGNIVVQTIPGPTLSQVFIEKFKASWPWYVARASGMVAAGALVLLMISGIGQITGYTFRLFEPLTAWATHRALGLVFAIGVIVHMASLLFDKFVPFSIINLLVPWTSNFKPVTILGFHFGSLYVALGVLAFYAIAAITITSLIWIDKNHTPGNSFICWHI